MPNLIWRLLKGLRKHLLDCFILRHDNILHNCFLYQFSKSKWNNWFYSIFHLGSFWHSHGICLEVREFSHGGVFTTLNSGFPHENKNMCGNRVDQLALFPYGRVWQSTQSSWWLNQPIWKICSSNWIMKPQGSGLKIKNIWVANTQQ